MLKSLTNELLNYSWHLFKYYGLKEVRHQYGDSVFIDLLNCDRVGQVTTEGIKVLSSPNVNINVVPHNIKFFYVENSLKDQSNESKLDSLSEPSIQ